MPWNRNLFHILTVFVLLMTLMQNVKGGYPPVGFVFPLSVCFGNYGQQYLPGDVWYPTKLEKCECHDRGMGGVSLCNSLPGCLDLQNNVRPPGDVWIEPQGMICNCSLGSQRKCHVKACLDNTKTIHVNGSRWFLSNCTRCMCEEMRILCAQHDIKAIYGHFVVTRKACFINFSQSSCVTDNETSRACKVYFRSSENGMFECASHSEEIRSEHRCNGVAECTDGSDEKDCQKALCTDNTGAIWRNAGLLSKPIHGHLSCECVNGSLKCQSRIPINFPAYGDPYVLYKETCDSKTCDVLKFLKERSDFTEGIEFRPKLDDIKKKGDSWTYKNCRFHFAGASQKKSCPSGGVLVAAQCNVYSGGICCPGNDICPGLKDIAKELRQHDGFYLCPNGFQIVSKNQSQCVERIVTGDVTCKDEKGNKYFEKAWWSPDECTECVCNNGSLSCQRNITDQFDREKENIIISTDCKQPQCNVWKFINEKTSCYVFKWGNKYHNYDTVVKSNGIPFYSKKTQYQPGCYFKSTMGPWEAYDMIKCTGYYPALRNTSFFSSDRHFLCQSGDQFIPKDYICNRKLDCDDKSDEIFCDTHYCPDLSREPKFWKRVAVHTTLNLKCSDVNENHTGVYHNMCVYKRGKGLTRTEWMGESCRCENKDVLPYIRSKFNDANVTSQRFLDILAANAHKMSNRKIIFQYLKKTWERNLNRNFPITPENDNETATFIISMVQFLKLNPAWTSERASNSICSYDNAILDRKSLTRDIFNDLQVYVSFRTPASTDALLTMKGNGMNRNFIGMGGQRAFGGPRSQWVRPKLELDISLYKVVSIATLKIEKEGKNITTKNYTETNIKGNQTLGKQINNATCQEIAAKSKKNGSQNSTYTKIKMTLMKPVMTNKQKFLEVGLMAAATVTMVMSIILLSYLKLKKSTKLFVHKSLMLSLCMANVVYMADVAFTVKNDYPDACSALSVIQHYFHTAVFTWMLAGAVHLYFKLIKVFSSFDNRIIYCLIGWGIPVFIVGTAALLKPSIYNMAPEHHDVDCGDQLSYHILVIREFCWLNDGFWIYNGPVLGLLVINAILFIVFLRIAFGKISSRFPNDNVRKAKKMFKGVAALLPILGIAWLLGFTVNFHWILLYISIVINSSQGIILCVVHCFMDDQVRKAIRLLRQKKQAMMSISPTPEAQRNGEPREEPNPKAKEEGSAESTPATDTTAVAPVETQMTEIQETKL